MAFHSYEGVVAPAFTPRAAGLHYTDLATGYVYLSNGSSSSANWIQIGTTASIAAHAALVSGVHGITAAAATVLDDATVSAMVDTLGGAAATGTGGLVRATAPTISGFTTIGSGDAGAVSFGGHYTSLGGVIGLGLGWASAGYIGVISSGRIGFTTSSTDGRGAIDAYISRIAANHLGLHNSTSAQSLSVYNTYTDASNYERGVFDWQTTANTLTIGTQNAGTGSASNIDVVAGGVRKLDYGITNANRWTSAVGFHATIVTSQYFQFPGTSFSASGGDGIVGFYNNAGLDFNRLQFGGTTSSFPALKRSTTTLQARLADDSAFTLLEASQVKTNNGTFLVSGTALTDGAAAAAGTLLNAPTAGNPTKWIPINDNGTIRHFPCW